MVPVKNSHFINLRVTQELLGSLSRSVTWSVCLSGVLETVPMSSRYTMANCLFTVDTMTAIVLWTVIGALRSLKGMPMKRVSPWWDGTRSYWDQIFRSWFASIRYSRLVSRTLLSCQGCQCDCPCEKGDTILFLCLHWAFCRQHSVREYHFFFNVKPMGHAHCLCAILLMLPASILSILICSKLRVSGPARYRAGWTGAMSRSHSSMQFLVVLIRSRCPSHTDSNSDRLSMNCWQYCL